MVKLSEWAARNGVHYQTAWPGRKTGSMPVPVVQTPSGTWLVTEPAAPAAGRVVAYCRVSSADQKADLERQVARVVPGRNGWGLAVGRGGDRGRLRFERASRRKLHRLLADPRCGDDRGRTPGPARPVRRRTPGSRARRVRTAPGRPRPDRDHRRPGAGHHRGPDLDVRPPVRARAAKNRAARAVAAATGRRRPGEEVPAAAGLRRAGVPVRSGPERRARTPRCARTAVPRGPRTTGRWPG